MIDFYEKVNNEYIQNNPIPDSMISWGSRDILIHETKNWILDSVLSSKTSKSRIVKDFLESYTDPDQDTMRKTFHRLFHFLQKTFRQGSINDSFCLSCCEMMKIGVGVPISFIVLPNLEGDQMWDVMISINGYDQYKIQDRFGEYIEQLTRAFSQWYSADIIICPKKIAIMEKDITNCYIQTAQIPCESVNEYQHQYTLDTIKRLIPELPWRIISNSSGLLDHSHKFIIRNLPFFEKLPECIMRYSAQDWYEYFAWRVIYEYSKYIPMTRDIYHKFFEKSEGQKQRSDAIIEAYDIANEYFGSYFGWIYSQSRQMCTETDVNEVYKIIENIRDTFSHEIRECSWMCHETKRRALYKIKNIRAKITFQKKFVFPSCEIQRSDVITNIIRCRLWKFRVYQTLAHQKIDNQNSPFIDFIHAHDVNAYYSPTLNTIVVGCGLIQEPFYYNQDLKKTYGGIGVVIAHEFFHGFDVLGSRYNGDSEFSSWIHPRDHQKYKNKISEIQKIYNVQIPETSSENACITMYRKIGEHIADINGVNLAFKSLMRTTNNKKKNRTFFENFARCLCIYRRSNFDDHFDEHASSSVRVNKTLLCLKPFCDEIIKMKSDNTFDFFE
jgi:putative endopeptidase